MGLRKQTNVTLPLYDVAKLLGISAQTADRHYTPWVAELQERAARLVKALAAV